MSIEIPNLCAPFCHCIPNDYNPLVDPFSCPDLGQRKLFEDFTPPEVFKFGSYDLNEDSLEAINEYLYKPEDCQPYPLLATVLHTDACDTLAPFPHNAVCAFVYVDEDGDYSTSCDTGAPYRLETFPNVESAEQCGGVVTHTGQCGACSSAQDLAVYLDPTLLLASYVCAYEAWTTVDRSSPEQAISAFGELVSCFEGLGFTPGCASIWASNAAHTDLQGCTDSCDLFLPCTEDPESVECQEALAGIYGENALACELNDCLSCDEEESGEIFAAFAGRTRRNSGIVTAFSVGQPWVFAGLKRDCETIANIGQDPCTRIEPSNSKKCKKKWS